MSVNEHMLVFIFKHVRYFDILTMQLPCEARNDRAVMKQCKKNNKR